MSHELILGDCIEKMGEMEEKSVEMVFTSPPFDNLAMPKGWPVLDLHAVGEGIRRVLVDDGVCVVAIQDKIDDCRKSCTSARLIVDWTEKVGLGYWADYIFWYDGPDGGWWKTRPRQCHDYLLVFVNGKDKPRVYNREHMEKKNPSTGKQRCIGTVLDYRKEQWALRHSGYKNDRDTSRSDFPAANAPKLAADMIRAFTNEGDTVLDPFGGTGNTVVEAKRHNRNCICIEVLEHVYEFIERRLKKDTGGLVV